MNIKIFSQIIQAGKKIASFSEADFFEIGTFILLYYFTVNVLVIKFTLIV